MKVSLVQRCAAPIAAATLLAGALAPLAAAQEPLAPAREPLTFTVALGLAESLLVMASWPVNGGLLRFTVGANWTVTDFFCPAASV